MAMRPHQVKCQTERTKRQRGCCELEKKEKEKVGLTLAFKHYFCSRGREDAPSRAKCSIKSRGRTKQRH